MITNEIRSNTPVKKKEETPIGISFKEEYSIHDPRITWNHERLSEAQSAEERGKNRPQNTDPLNRAALIAR